MATYVMWFRKDLRIEDNTALNHALNSLKNDDQLLFVFHLDETQYKIGYKSHDFFFETLHQFRKTLQQHGGDILFLTGNLSTAFTQLKKEYPNWQKLYFNLDNRGYGRKRDFTLIHFLASQEIDVCYYEEAHLHSAKDILKPDGTPYKKFTPYYKKWRTLPTTPYENVAISSFSKHFLNHSDFFNKGNLQFEWLLKKQTYDFSSLVGEKKAHQQLNEFVLTKLETYEIDRDYPSLDGTSKLSYYLSTGSISIRKVWQSCNNMPSSNGKETFLKELAWRDFYHMIYHYHPMQYKKELIEKYQSIEWCTNPHLFDKWKNGQTGYPIIDAAMRQLNQTGWMHNRLRMLVASFLTKDLLIDWRLGERYFSEALIDYDAASNIGGWQWAASTGTDASPYFRIFNPTTQSMKFDQNGDFIKTYVPELANLPLTLVHEPSKMTNEEQIKYNCILDKDYPMPIIDHQKARQIALTTFKLQID